MEEIIGRNDLVQSVDYVAFVPIGRLVRLVFEVDVGDLDDVFDIAAVGEFLGYVKVRGEPIDFRFYRDVCRVRSFEELVDKELNEGSFELLVLVRGSRSLVAHSAYEFSRVFVWKSFNPALQHGADSGEPVKG